MTFRDPQHAADWLSGIVDGEGSVYAGPGRRRRLVKVVNTDLALIEATEAALDLLGVAHRRNVARYANGRWKPLYSVAVGTRDGIERLAAVLTLASPEKADRLALLPSLWTRVRLDPNELRRLSDEGATLAELASRFGVGTATIHRHLRRAA